MGEECYSCVLMYKCVCLASNFCKHSLKNHKSLTCNPHRCFTWKNHEDYLNQKSMLEISHLSNIIIKIKDHLARNPVEPSPEVLNYINGIKVEMKISEDFVNVFFFKNQQLKRYDVQNNCLSSIVLDFKLLSYVSVCTSLHKVYLVGGADIENFIPNNKIYSLNLKKNTYKLLPDLLVPCYMPASVVLYDELFVIGGKRRDFSKVSMIQVINLITHTVRTLDIEECKSNSVSAVVYQESICYNCGEIDMIVIKSDGTRIDSFQVKRQYGKIVALASSPENLFILQETCIVLKSGALNLFMKAVVSFEWMQQAPVFYKNSIFLVDYERCKVLAVDIDNQKLFKYETVTSNETSFFLESNESYEDPGVTNQIQPILLKNSGSSQNDSLLNLSSVNYS